MGTWAKITKEINEELKKNNKQAFDKVRRKYLKKIHKATNRDVILYASNWLINMVSPGGTEINHSDIQGFMEVIENLNGKKLDLILHSPGGSAEAAEAIISFLREQYEHIRVIIPYSAMSAATILACAANEIIMAKHSYIGPIDPQIILQTQLGAQMIPVQDILDQFELAKEECENEKFMNTWLPILPQYGPALLKQCKNAQDLSKDLVKKNLSKYMFKDQENSKELIDRIVDFLSNHQNFKSHRRMISRKDAKDIGLKILNLEDFPELKDSVISLFSAFSITFNSFNIIKIFENQLDDTFIDSISIQNPIIPTPNFLPPMPPLSKTNDVLFKQSQKKNSKEENNILNSIINLELNKQNKRYINRIEEDWDDPEEDEAWKDL